MDNEDYIYAEPSLGDWLADNPSEHISLSAVFEAGVRYGVDMERGALWGALPELSEDAVANRKDFVSYLREYLVSCSQEDAGRGEHEARSTS